MLQTVTQNTQTPATTSSGSANSTTGSSATTQAQETESAALTAAADFNSFLQLLTAQVRNQDPLSPLDSTQFVEQLASFSGVEQQIATNSRLDSLLEQFIATNSPTGGPSLAAAADLIDQYVVTPATAQSFNGNPIQFSVPPGTVNGQAEIIDASGTAVATIDIPENGIIRWDGRTANGVSAPEGQYALNLVRTNADGANEVVGRGLVLSRVTQIRLDGDETVLVTSNNEALEADAIQGIVDRSLIDGS